MKNILKNNNGSTIIFLTVLILTSVLIVTFTVGEIVKLGILKGRTQAYSTKAYFAAETGAERILYEIRSAAIPKDPATDWGCTNDQYICFNSVTDGSVTACADEGECLISDTQIISGASYKIRYQFNGTVTTLTSYGTYSDTTRVVELKY